MNNNKNEKTPDRYDWRLSIKDTVNGFRKESNDFVDFDHMMEKIDPSLNKKYSDDGPPSYWLKKWVGSNLPGFETQGLVLMYAYFYEFTSKRIAEVKAEVDSIKNQTQDFKTDFTDLSNKVENISNEQTVLGNSIAQVENDLKANLADNLKSINQVSTDQATRVINALP